MYTLPYKKYGTYNSNTCRTSNNVNSINNKDFGSRAKVEVDFRNEPGTISKSCTINDLSSLNIYHSSTNK